MTMERFQISYYDQGPKDIPGWKGKIVESATVLYRGPDGQLIIRFTDGSILTYAFNELGFWEEKKAQ